MSSSIFHDEGLPPPASTSLIGVVAIGRNEGERLRRCLESVRNDAACVVYVDSGSSDGSVTLGRQLADSVVELDLKTPFTAARARNEGFRRLIELDTAVNYVFFVDGDCEVFGGFLQKARAFLDSNPGFAAVWGLRRERWPEKSVYNHLCDIEWQEYPLGETKWFGGDAMIRVPALQRVRGYRSELICGEEPELAIRLRQAGWRIWRLNEPMTLHDAAMFRFDQWWKRMMRGGYGFAQGAALHGAPPELLGVIESRRALVWGLGIPLVILLIAPVIGWWSLLLLLAYPLQVMRLTLGHKKLSAPERFLRAAALVCSKFPETLGYLRFRGDHYRKVRSKLIEYK
jgi:GT2 family glycosyltransferase